MTEFKNLNAYISQCKGSLSAEEVESVKEMGRQAREASAHLRVLTRSEKDHILHCLIDQLTDRKEEIKAANDEDLTAFKTLQEEEEQNLKEGLSPKYTAALKSRLDLFAENEKYFKSMIASIESIINLPEVTGIQTRTEKLTSGITLSKQHVALGVMFMIYESRPNVTADAAALNIKAGNACILKGGKEALNSNLAIADCIAAAFKEAGFEDLQNAVQVVDSTNRDVTGAFLNLDECVDFVVPRGGKGLTSVVSRESKVPVIYHLDGTCHIYVDKDADLRKAVAIILNAKTQSYGTCNTLESLILHEEIVDPLLGKLCKHLQKADRKRQLIDGSNEGIEIVANERLADLLKSKYKYPSNLVRVLGDDSEYHIEHLSPTLTLSVVGNLGEAINHIEKYGSHHTDAIITEDIGAAEFFLNAVNSASVYVNMSTRFADGFEYGLGAEIGISTSKMNPRGPVGLEGLTSQKWIGRGDPKTGSIRGGFDALSQYGINSLDDI